MFYLVLVALFVFSENSFAIDEPMDTMEEPSKIDTSKKNDEIISPNGTEGVLNTFYGLGAGYNNTTGDFNSFFGANAGLDNTTGNENSFFGMNAGYLNSTGGYNSFFGRSAGGGNTTGDYNSFFGVNAGYSNGAGNENSFFGMNAGLHNSTGGYNSFFGQSAGEKNTTGYYNSFFGRSAGEKNTTGDYNSFFGVNAGISNSTGTGNTFFGWNAGYLNSTGTGNVFLGKNAGFTEKGSNKLYIDNLASATPLIWGDFDANNVVIYGGFRAIATSSSSDRRWKKNIKSLKSSLDKVSNLQGVSYEWKTGEYSDFGLMEGRQIGLVAQDVEQVLPELVSEGKDGYKAVSYTKLTAVLVEAVKELKAENHSQKKLIEEQQNQFEKQQSEIEELRSMIKELKS